MYAYIIYTQIMEGRQEIPVPSADVPRELSNLLRDLSRLRSRVARSVDQSPLAPSELDLLRLVIHQPGIAIGEAARALAVRASNLSATARALTEKGLLTRESAAEDRRISMLYPTERATQNMEILNRRWEEILSVALADLPAEELMMVTRAMPALRAMVDAIPETHITV